MHDPLMKPRVPLVLGHGTTIGLLVRVWVEEPPKRRV